MCIEPTSKRVKPFNRGYKIVRKNKKGDYISEMKWFSPSEEPRPTGKWLDEMPYRPDDDLLNDSAFGMGWHIFSTIKQARRWILGSADSAVIVRVECYGLESPYGLGLTYGKPAGCFQFMKILEEVA